MTNLIVKNHVRKFLLEEAGKNKKMANGEPRYTQIRPGYIEELEGEFRLLMTRKMANLPSAGRTIG